jgi:DNA-binding IclR family transcriptional regulator
MRMFPEPGHRVPGHATGGGKAILAYTPGAVARLVRAPLARFTAHTITTPSELMAELAHIRALGYAIDDEEYEEAVTCVAAPVFGHTAAPVAALSASGPTSRLEQVGDHATLGELVGRAATEASREFGYRGPSVWAAAVPSESEPATSTP